MASLTGQLVAETYKALLKVIDNDVLTASEKQITDGFGGGSNVFIDSNGFLRANKYKITNGLATQFLKADGSLDANTYLTSITSAQVTTALGYTPVTDQRTLTINGVTYNLTANRSWTVEGTAAVWGNITGTLSNQTDLQAALNAKYNVPAGTISQYIRGDGSLATFPTLPGGLPTGGSAGQILAKIDATDYNTHWIDNYATQTKNEVKLGATLSKGAAVYVSSANGTNMIVSAASNTSEATSSKTFGLLETGGVTNDLVKCVTFGLLAGLDTSTASAGDPVWLGVNGALIFGLANKPVAPAHLVYIGVVTRVQSNNGEIFVNVQNGFELNEIHDVLIQSVANNQGLFYESSSGLWKNKSIATVLGYTPQAQLDGTGFVKTSGTTITYDNSTYLTTTDAASTYQRLDKMVSNLLASDTEYPNSNAVIAALALKADAANPVFTGNMTISGAEPKLYFTDTDQNPDYFIGVDAGFFRVYDQTAGATRFVINSDGNISTGVGKSITAGSFIKDGGTATQFLKADGSVDSTDYATVASLANYLLSATAASTYQTLANLSTDLTTSATKYPSVNAVNAGLATKQPLDADLTAIAGLTGTSGFLKKTAADTWTLDTSTYLTTGDASTTYLAITTAASTYQRLDKMVSNLLPSDTEYPNSNAVINALALKADAANPVFTGNMTISGAEPKLYFVDTDQNPDYTVFIDSGFFYIYDQTAGATRFSINSSGNATFNGDVTVALNKNLLVDGDLRFTGSDSYIWSPNTVNGFTGIWDSYNNKAAIFYTNGGDLQLMPTSGGVTVGNSITAGSFVKSGGTASQYLMADGSVSTLSNLVTGSGNSGYHTKWTGASTLGNGIIFDNGSSIGISTITPFNGINNTGLNIERGGHSTLLLGDGFTYGGVVQSSDSIQRVFVGANVYDDPSNSWSQFVNTSGYGAVDVIGNSDGGGMVRILVGSGNDSSYSSTNIFLEAYKNNSNSYFKIRTNTDNALYISNSGNVGLNTTTDSGYKLDVSGTGRFTQLLIAKNGTTGTGLSANLAIMGGGEFLSTGAYAGYFWEDRTSNINWYGWYSVSGSINLWNGTTNILSINGTNGALTLSNTIKATRYLITPNGTANLYNIVDSDQSFAGSYTMQAGGGSSGFGGAIVAYGHAHASKPGWITAGISANSGGRFTVNTQGLGGGTDVFSVLQNGNVLIGTTTDAGFKFEVNGAVKFNSTLSTTGNIQIDATSPLFISNASSSTYFGGLSIRNSGVEKARFAANSTSGAYIYSPTFNGFGILSDTINPLVIASNGSVTLSNTLDVASIGYFRGSSNSVDNIRLYNSDGNYSYIRTTSASNTNNTWIDTPLGATLWLGWDNPGQLRTAGTYSQVFVGTGRGEVNESVRLHRGNIEGRDISGNITYRILSNNSIGSSTFFNFGNVGIGNNSPNNKLQVGTPGVLGSWMGATIQDGIGIAPSGSRIAVYLYSDGSSLFGLNAYDYGNGVVKNVTVGWSGANVILAQDGGSVGLGTSSPSYKFHVVGTGATGWLSKFQNNNKVDTFISHYEGYGMAIESTSNNDIYLLKLVGGNGSTKGTNERFKVNGNGAVLVNNSSAVSGRISAASLQVTNEVYSRGSYGGFFWEDRSNSANWGGWYTQGGSTFMYNGSSNIMNINMSSGAITGSAFFESSDFRLKTLIEHNPIVSGIENLQAKLYEKNGKIELGYFAQDAEKIMPYAVTKNDEGFLNLSYREVHTAKIARLEKEVAELKAQLNFN